MESRCGGRIFLHVARTGKIHLVAGGFVHANPSVDQQRNIDEPTSHVRNDLAG
jgi:hypothetical protein